MPRSSAVLESLNRASREASVRIVTEALAGLSPSTELGKLIDEFSKSEFDSHFRSMTLSEFLGAIGGAAAPTRRRGRPAGSKTTAAPRAKRGGINTRTAEGRAELDAALSGHLSSAGSAGSEELQKALGVSAAQIRQSVKRLSKTVKVTGQKRATKYHWKAAGAKAAAAPAKTAKKRPVRRKKAKAKTKAKKK